MDFESIRKTDCWEKISYCSRHHVVVRVITVVLLTWYLLNYHLIRNMGAWGRRCAAAGMVLCLLTCASFGTYAEETPLPEEEIHYELSITVTEPETQIEVGYQQSPEYQIVLINTGEGNLTGLNVQTSVFELFYLAEDGTRQPVDPEEDQPSEDETLSGEPVLPPEEQGDDPDVADPDAVDPEVVDPEGDGPDGEKEYVMPQELAMEQTITLYAVLPMDLSCGMVEDKLSISAMELEGIKEIPLAIEIKEAEIDEMVPDETLDPQWPEQNPSDEQEPSDEQDSVPEQELPVDEMPAPQLPEHPEIEEQTGIDLQPETEEQPDAAPKIEISQRTAGYSMGGTFFSLGNSVYEIQVSEESDTQIQQLYCEIGAEKQMVPVENGTAQITVPENVNGLMKIGYLDEQDQPVELHTEYVISEKNAPQITYERLDTEDGQYAHVIIEESGEIKSGINEYECAVDGAEAVVMNQGIVKSAVLASGASVPVRLEFDVPLDGEELHSFTVNVSDYTGNVSTVDFNMVALSKDVISVVLPTSFYIGVCPMEETDQIYSQDIVICNKSEFPIDVNVVKTAVDIDQTIEEGSTYQTQVTTGSGSQAVLDLHKEAEQTGKHCQLKMQLLTAYQEKKEFLLNEGLTENITSFRLSEGWEGTDSQQLLAMDGVDHVETPDYAIINLRGTLEQQTAEYWRDGDLKVEIVFEFRKASEN